MPKDMNEFRQDLMKQVKKLANCNYNQVAYASRTKNVNMIMMYVYGDNNIINLLDDLKRHHKESYEHTLRVTLYTTEMIDILSIPRIDTSTNFDMHKVYIYGALLHDIGKVKIPLAILDKKGRLDPQEMVIMQSHTMESVNITRNLYAPVILSVIAAHSQAPKGGGYPNPAPLVDKPLQLVGVCDRFDALTSKRVYKPAMPVEKSIQIIQEDGFAVEFIIALSDNYN